jgi:hypothetical protein
MQLKHLKRFAGHQNKRTLTNNPREIRYSNRSWQRGQSSFFLLGKLSVAALRFISVASSMAINNIYGTVGNTIGLINIYQVSQI